MVNTTLIVFMIITAILLFTSMILSAMAASYVNKNEKDKAHYNASASAILSGVSLAALIIIAVIYFYTNKIEIMTGVAKAMQLGGKRLEVFAGPRDFSSSPIELAELNVPNL